VKNLSSSIQVIRCASPANNATTSKGDCLLQGVRPRGPPAVHQLPGLSPGHLFDVEVLVDLRPCPRGISIEDDEFQHPEDGEARQVGKDDESSVGEMTPVMGGTSWRAQRAPSWDTPMPRKVSAQTHDLSPELALAALAPRQRRLS